MTLIETIVAFAIISIVVAVATMGVNTMAGLSARTRNSNTANENIEILISQNSVGKDSENLRFSFTAGGETYEIEGNFRSFSDELTNEPITVFLPKDPEGNK